MFTIKMHHSEGDSKFAVRDIERPIPTFAHIPVTIQDKDSYIIGPPTWNPIGIRGGRIARNQFNQYPCSTIQFNDGVGHEWELQNCYLIAGQPLKGRFLITYSHAQMMET